MPFYEYECFKCGDRFEFLHLGGDEVVKCEKCGTKKVKKVPSSFGFGFKGFGSSSPAPPDPVAASESENKTPSGACGCSRESCGCG